MYRPVPVKTTPPSPAGFTDLLFAVNSCCGKGKFHPKCESFFERLFCKLACSLRSQLQNRAPTTFHLSLRDDHQ